jgi:sugar-specific transcriptional regulator TrmB
MKLEGNERLSLKRIFKALEHLGLSLIEARIYVFLEKNGAQNDKDIAKALKIRENELIRSLKILQDKQIVKASVKETAEFSAVAFEKAIDLLIELRKEQARSLQDRKMELLSNWQKMKRGYENN